MSKTLQKKVPKKVKQLYSKLGVEHITGKDSELVSSLDELLSVPPSIIRVKSKRDFSLNIGNKTVMIKGGKELIMPLGIYLRVKEDKKTHTLFMEPANTKFKDTFNRYRGQDLTDKNLLVWRFGGIGDLMFSQPLIMFLKDKYPTCKITYATAPGNVSLFDSWPEGLLEHVTIMPFDAKVMDDNDYHMTFEGTIERCKEAHSVNAYDIFMRTANVEFDLYKYQTDLVPDEETVNKFKKYIPDNTVIIQSRSSAILRTYPLFKLHEIMNKLTDSGYYIGLLDMKEMAPMYNKFVNTDENLRNKDKILNLANGSESLTECIALISLACGTIGIDSSITHMSAALKKPTVGLYGPFAGELRMKYYKTGDWVEPGPEWNNKCGKQPCFFHEPEFKNCPCFSNKKYSDCLIDLDTDKIVNKFLALLGKQL